MEILLAADIVPGLTPGGASPAPTGSGLIGWRLTRRAEARRLHSHGTSHGTLSWHAKFWMERCWFYSVRRAFMGWMEAARFAGMMAATKEQMASATAAIVRASGSQDGTP
jgi:hypothetical protein